MNDPAIPFHVAVIMDGNGRWATARGLPRTEGHRQGLTAAKRVVAAASKASTLSRPKTGNGPARK